MHSIDYLVVSKREEIMPAAEEYAAFTVDRGENPTGSYHGNLKIHDTPVCDSYDEAMVMITNWDTGWYSDHAVQFKDKDRLKPTKEMESLETKAKKMYQARDEYIEATSVKHRKSDYLGCKKCGSKISREYLRGEHCPVCGSDLRADYIIERIEKYDKDIEAIMRKYREKKNRQTGKCPVKWLVKVEVHC